MKKNNKVNLLKMLRDIRDNHSQQSINKPWGELRKENIEALEKYAQRVKEVLMKRENDHL